MQKLVDLRNKYLWVVERHVPGAGAVVEHLVALGVEHSRLGRHEPVHHAELGSGGVPPGALIFAFMIFHNQEEN